ncbi:MAG: hypothetical protein ACYDHQ_10705 [Coriobacteriia bacterium]
MLGQIAENYPDTLFNQIPKGTFNFGGAGINAWRSTCGVPIGVGAVLAQLGAPQNVKDEIFRFYESTPLPTEACRESYEKGDWETPGWTFVVPKKDIPQAVPKGILCHASLGRWVEAAGGPDGAWVMQFGTGTDAVTKAASDRCGKLVYDNVYRLATLINDWKAGTLPAGTGTLDPAVATCLTSGCHGGNYDVMVENCAPHVNGKMKCDESCHQ